MNTSLSQTVRHIFVLMSTYTVAFTHSFMFAETTIIQVSLPTNDLVYDSFTDMIYASVPSSAGVPRGNTITPINPYTGAIGTSVFVASEPTLLALADDGSRIYVASDSTNLVTPFLLSTMSRGTSFVIGGPDRRVDDMEVAPGRSDALAVSLRRVGISPRGAGLAVFVNGIQLPNATTDAAINNVIEFGETADILYGHAHEISDLDFNSFVIDLSSTGGVMGNRFHVKRLIASIGSDMEFDNGQMYFTNGQVLIANIPAAIGSFNGRGPLEPDSSVGRTFFVDGNSIKLFDQMTFVPLDEIEIPGMSGSPGSLIRLGGDGLAFRTSSNQVFIVRSSVVPEPSGMVLALVGLVTLGVYARRTQYATLDVGSR